MNSITLLSPDYQSDEESKETKVNRELASAADEQMKARLKYSAPSGYSEHHTGLAVDINETEEWFKDSPAYPWLLEHAGEFGFENSFPENNVQGLGFEPWHWRYVGVKNAQEIKESGKCLEEFIIDKIENHS